MLRIGEFNQLKVDRETPQGLYLVNDQGDDVLLPVKYIPEGTKIGDELEVFVYKDSEDRIISTTLKPLAILEDFACLKIVSTTPHGAFADMGIAKDLFIPFKEQKSPLQEGENPLIFVYIDDETERLVGSTKIADHLEYKEIELDVNQEVELIAWEESPLGWKVIINRLYSGLIFHNQIFGKLQIGDNFKGYVKAIRDDGKIDIVKDKPGFKNQIDDHQQLILSYLQKDTLLPLTDHSDANEIYNLLGISKKAFKRAIGTLFRAKKIVILKKGIRINESENESLK